MDINNVIEAAKTIKEFCKGNECENCPFMQREECIFVGLQLPQDFVIEENSVKVGNKTDWNISNLVNNIY